MKRVINTGFTLVEVLIALVIVAIGLVAALRANGMSLFASGVHQDRVYASWIAQNRANLKIAMNEWPDTGKKSEDVVMGGRQYVVTEVVKTTPNPNFRRLELQVMGKDEDSRPYQLILLLSRL